MENNFYEQERLNEQPSGGSFAAESQSRYTARVFGLMFLGLLATFAVAFWLSWTWSGYYFLVSAFTAVPFLHVILMVAELAVVLVLNAALRKLSPAAATVLFFVYAVLTGATFAVIFLVYDLSSIVLAFGATALYFGGMAVFGHFTTFDLSRLRNLLIGGLIALIVGNLLMLFLPGLEVMDHVLCSIGVVIFLAYTAYDTQKIKAFYAAYQTDAVMLRKTAVISALELYLDFVNLFLYVLRLFGKKRN